MLFVILGFIVGFAIAASSFRELLWDKDDWKIAWAACVFSGTVVALFELLVLKTS